MASTYEVTTAAASLEYDPADGTQPELCQIDNTHFLTLWGGGGSDGYAQVMAFNTTTWVITTAAAAFEFDVSTGLGHTCIKIDTNHFINFWQGSGNDGFTQILEVNTTTWVVTTAAAPLEYDTQIGMRPHAVKVDTNHVLNVWRGGASQHAHAQIFEVNTTTWAVTTAAASLVFDDAGTCDYFTLTAIDENHFFVTWKGGASGHYYAQVLEVNTTTWAVTTAAASLDYDDSAQFPEGDTVQMDDNHFVNFFNGADGDGFAQVFTVNTTTWAVTTTVAVFEFDVSTGISFSAEKIDDNHCIAFWRGASDDGFAQVFTVNTSTWAISTTVDTLEFDTQNGDWNDCIRIDTQHYINAWQGDAGDGFVQAFTVDVSEVTFTPNAIIIT